MPTWAQDWVYIGGAPAIGDYYLNRRSIEKQRDYVTGWVRWEHSDAGINGLGEWARNRGLSYSMVLYGAAKGSRQIRMFQVAFYDKNGRNITTTSAQQLERMGVQWKYCTPGTMEEVVWEALMDAAGIRY